MHRKIDQRKAATPLVLSSSPSILYEKANSLSFGGPDQVEVDQQLKTLFPRLSLLDCLFLIPLLLITAYCFIFITEATFMDTFLVFSRWIVFCQYHSFFKVPQENINLERNLVSILLLWKGACWSIKNRYIECSEKSRLLFRFHLKISLHCNRTSVILATRSSHS